MSTQTPAASPRTLERARRDASFAAVTLEHRGGLPQVPVGAMVIAFGVLSLLMSRSSTAGLAAGLLLAPVIPVASAIGFALVARSYQRRFGFARVARTRRTRAANLTGILLMLVALAIAVVMFQLGGGRTVTPSYAVLAAAFGISMLVTRWGYGQTTRTHAGMTAGMTVTALIGVTVGLPEAPLLFSGVPLVLYGTGVTIGGILDHRKLVKVLGTSAAEDDE